MDYFLVYLWSRLDAIMILLFTIGSIIPVCILFSHTFISNEGDWEDKHTKIAKKWTCIAIICFVLATLRYYQ